MFRYSRAVTMVNNTISHCNVKEAVDNSTYTYFQKYIVNEPNFETLLHKMAQYRGAHFSSQCFEGYTINKLENYNTPDEDKTKSFMIECPQFKNCNFTNAQILKFESRSGQFENCNFTGSVFSECRFHSNMFKRCNFTGANFHTYTDGSGANVGFSECIFDNGSIKVTRGGDESYTFKNCSLKDTDMSDCNFSINKVTIDNCNTSGTKFNNCKIYELDSSYLFRCEFLVKGGEIVNNPSMIDTGLSLIGRHINPFR